MSIRNTLIMQEKLPHIPLKDTQEACDLYQRLMHVAENGV